MSCWELCHPYGIPPSYCPLISVSQLLHIYCLFTSLCNIIRRAVVDAT